MREGTEGTLSPERREQLVKMSSNLKSQTDAIMSPEQHAAVDAAYQRDNEVWARMKADGELMMIQNHLGTSPEQEKQLFPILYDFALKYRGTNSVSPTEKADALARVLTPAQADLYRQFTRDRSFEPILQMGQR